MSLDGIDLSNFTSLDEYITLVGLLEEGDSVHVSFSDAKDAVEVLQSIKKDIEDAHAVLTEFGVPDLGGGIHGVTVRLKHLKGNQP